MQNEDTTGQHQLESVPVLAAIHELQEDRAYRDRRGLFFVEGVRNFIAAVDHGYPLETLVYSEKLLINPVSRKLVRRLKRAGVPFARISPEQSGASPEPNEPRVWRPFSANDFRHSSISSPAITSVGRL